MSADILIPDENDGQRFTRHSYVLNRPLTLVDPTGHDDEEVFDATGCHIFVDAGGGNSYEYSYDNNGNSSPIPNGQDDDQNLGDYNQIGFAGDF